MWCTATLLSIALVNDNWFEPDEAFFVTLSNVQNATVLVGQAVGTILNDDQPLPNLSIANAAGSEANSPLKFTISLTSTSTLPVSGNFVTSNGNAVAPGDYTAQANGSFLIPTGALSTTISITINNDVEVEVNETFTITLSNIQNANLVITQAIGTILNDDQTPLVLSIGDASASEANATMSFVISLDKVSPSPVDGRVSSSDIVALYRNYIEIAKIVGAVSILHNLG